MSRREWWITTVALAVAAPFVFGACGGNGGSASQDAGVFRVDAGLAADAATCPALPCLAGATVLIEACAPSGTCTEQVIVSGQTAAQNKCFSNGVKISVTGMNLASGATTTVMTVRKDGAACYSLNGTSDSATVGSVVYRDGAGADLITEMVSGATTAVSCPGGAGTIQDSSCDAALSALRGLYPFTTPTCTTGTCTF
jgi:hypothetical protein